MTLLITILPSIIILAYFIISDKFKEPRRIIAEIFLLGVVITIPAGYLNDYIVETFENGEIINDAMVGGFFAGGLVEEVLKFLILYFFVLRKNEFNEPMDGIVYGVVASLGFATLENIDYVYFHAESYGISSLEMAQARAWTAVPMHGLNGCVMGFYFGLFAFKGDKKYLGYAFILPYIFHGAYNFLLSINFFYALGILIIVLIKAYLLHKNLKYLQKNKFVEDEVKRV